MASEGFLGRWARLKRDADGSQKSPADSGAALRALDSTVPGTEGKASRDAADESRGTPGPAGGAEALPHGQAISKGGEPPGSTGQAPGTAPAALPSLESLAFESDYSMFMGRDVDPKLRVSALKKLFTDPHFNRMDGLDVYIDDYGKPDPVPRAMMRKLNQSRLLGLFEEDEPVAGTTPADADKDRALLATANSPAGRDSNSRDASAPAASASPGPDLASGSESGPDDGTDRADDAFDAGIHGQAGQEAGNGAAAASSPEDSPPDSRQPT